MKTDEKRLQVGHIGIRTAFEILFTMCAVVFCVVLIMNSFESDYKKSSDGELEKTTAQLSEYISPVIKKDSLVQPGDERGEFAGEKYSEFLDSCLTTEDIVYSGGIYTLENGVLYLSAQSSEFEPLKDSDRLSELALMVTAGTSLTEAEGDVSVTYTPLSDENGEGYGLLVIAAERQGTMEYAGVVRNRLSLFAVICCLSVIVYFTVSGIISSMKKRKTEVAK